MKENLTIIIMGATGDLTKLKLIPAIYNLLKNKSVEKLSVIGVAFSDTNSSAILEASKQNITNVDENIWTQLNNIFQYQSLNFNKIEDYANLKLKVDELEKKDNLPCNRLFYLATLPDHFEIITENLNKVNLINSNDGWQRVIYEKPFGQDLKSAERINKSIEKVFSEKNIYRADHYLGKELIANISLFRFTNRIIESLWSRRDIESVQIILDEDFGIKKRGIYYDKYGAVKDIMQSHALQILALLAMEAPVSLSGEYVREKKAEALKMVKVKDIILGQYEGYIAEENIKADSKTETFFAAKLEINNERWKDVPFFIRAGKNLSKKETSVHVRFKNVDCLLAKMCPSDGNYISIKIQPEDGFSFEVNSKVPQKSYEVETIKLDHNRGNVVGLNTPEAYSVLLGEVIKGDQSFFIRKDEMEYSWKIVDDIKMDKSAIFTYKIGSTGPKELEAWNIKHNLIWKS